MSDEVTTETTETDQEKNWRAMEERVKALEAENTELRPLAVAKAVKEAGFDPDSDKGRVLADLLGDQRDKEKVLEVAAKYGWEPQEPAPVLNENERVAASLAERTAQLNSVTSSDTPPSLDQMIAEAQEAGNTSLAIRLMTQKAVQAGPRA